MAAVGGGGNSGGTGPGKQFIGHYGRLVKEFWSCRYRNQSCCGEPIPTEIFCSQGRQLQFSDGKSNAWFMNVDSEGNTIWANAAGADDLEIVECVGNHSV